MTIFFGRPSEDLADFIPCNSTTFGIDFVNSNTWADYLQLGSSDIEKGFLWDVLCT